MIDEIKNNIINYIKQLLDYKFINIQLINNIVNENEITVNIYNLSNKKRKILENILFTKFRFYIDYEFESHKWEKIQLY